MNGETINGSKRRMPAAAAFVLALALCVIGGLGLVEAQAQTQTQPQTQVRPLALGSVAATVANTNLRDQPGTDGSILLQMPVNSRAIVQGGPFNDGWYWLDYNGKLGYASGQYLVPVDANYTPVTSPTARPTNTPLPPTATPTPDSSIPTDPNVYTNLWIGEMNGSGNVRSGPGLDQKILKGWWKGRRVILYQQVKDSKGDTWYRVSDPPEPPMYVHNSLISKVMPIVYEGAKYKGRWININITQQVVTAMVDGTPVKVTLTSTGKGKENATELGVWKIYWRLPKQDMDGGNLAAGDYYNLKDVPYPQYFHTSGEALHGTYWHDNFGYPMSHGCVNLSTPMSEWFYGWANVGTIVYVHN